MSTTVDFGAWWGDDTLEKFFEKRARMLTNQKQRDDLLKRLEAIGIERVMTPDDLWRRVVWPEFNRALIDDWTETGLSYREVFLLSYLLLPHP